ncbi:hypothetical protein DSO57_1016389 [Entomophthora muscae]|uniref:Uncharacterized protein n=1 Tax=Entomophthora muscae TaxID=34485 RepID=A0ACC2S6X2_9FUNG|nr:hypothetical protein DSO57_1016389 [Entomophthora muscae]
MKRTRSNKAQPELKMHTKTSTITKPLPATKQIHTITTQKPATTKPFPAANMQMHVATAQASTKFASPTCKPPKNQPSVSQSSACQQPSLCALQHTCCQPPSPCPLMPGCQSPSTPWVNCQIGKPERAISPKPNLGETAVQVGSLPNGERINRLFNNENHAPNSVNELGCMKEAQLALCNAN